LDNNIDSLGAALDYPDNHQNHEEFQASAAK